MTGQPSKPCASCGRTIEWRRKWARNWGDVRYCSDACRRHKLTDTDRALELALRESLGRRGARVDPLTVARAVGGDHWQRLVEPARRAARRLVAAGDYEILSGGRVVDPSTAKGELLLRRK